MLEEAERYRNSGQLSEAERLYRQVLQHNSNIAEAWHSLGLIAAAVRNHATAVSLFSRALALDPADVATRLDLATSMKAAGRPTEALALFQETWKREFGPDFPAAGDSGIRELVGRLCTDPIVPWGKRLDALLAYAELTEELGAFRGFGPLLEQVRTSVILDGANPAELTIRLNVLLAALGFLKTSDRQWNSRIFHELALPWMQEALALGLYDLALALENTVVAVYTRQTETEQHFHDCFSRWVPAMREAGRRAGARLSPISWPREDGAPVIGFFLHSASLLAHVEVLLNMLEGWSGLDPKPFVPRVYVFSGSYQPMLERFARIGVPVVLLEQSCDEAGKDRYRQLLCLRRRCAEERVTAIVWVSVATVMAFAFAMRLAPVQIWWASKYHSLEFDEIDGYLTGGGIAEQKRIGTRIWRNGRNSFTNLYDATLAPEAQRIRGEYNSYDVVLGTFGREEKLNSKEFLESIAAILRSSPRVAFLWTGKTRLASIQRVFEDGGVAERCFFAGWVNTRLYAQAVDVFLDSFPFPCGVTAMEAMAAGKPVLLYASDEAYETGLHGLISPLLKGEAGTVEEQEGARDIFHRGKEGSLYFCAADPQEYVRDAIRLIREPDLRQRSGLAYQTFARKYLQDVKQMAMSYSRHFLEIIKECRDRGAPRAGRLLQDR